LFTAQKESTHAPLKEFVLASHCRDFISKATKKLGRFPEGLLTGLLSGSIDSDGDSTTISQWPPNSHGWSTGSESFFFVESNSTTMISRNSTFIVDFIQVKVIIWWTVKSTGVIKDEHHCQDGKLVRG
jgi:hypothetical protein